MLETRAHVLKAKQIKQHVPAGVRHPGRYQLPVCIVCQLVGFINSHLNRNGEATSQIADSLLQWKSIALCATWRTLKTVLRVP